MILPQYHRGCAVELSDRNRRPRRRPQRRPRPHRKFPSAPARRPTERTNARHRSRHDQRTVRARLPRPALPGGEPWRVATAREDSRIRERGAHRGPGRADPLGGTRHRRSGRVHLERRRDDAAGGATAQCRTRRAHRRGRARGQSRDRRATHLRARRSRDHRPGGSELRAAVPAIAPGPEAAHQGDRRSSSPTCPNSSCLTRSTPTTTSDSASSTSKRRAAARSSASSACPRWTGPPGPSTSIGCSANLRACTGVARGVSSSSTAPST